MIYILTLWASAIHLRDSVCCVAVDSDSEHCALYICLRITFFAPVISMMNFIIEKNALICFVSERKCLSLHLFLDVFWQKCCCRPEQTKTKKKFLETFKKKLLMGFSLRNALILFWQTYEVIISLLAMSINVDYLLCLAFGAFVRFKLH